ncbi:hypothetical protein [Effusibacillus pohliae]|uniref:hypothetical protein n=1 Tax=Effusibacillus pohliae TaxID=232270 RepID=UPI0003761F80|nr:hypothetical protein [Effusibacillus pohliae]
MLDFLLVAGSMYLMYRWGIRQMVRSQIVKSWMLDRVAYSLFMATGCTLSLYLSVLALFPLIADWSVPAKSLIPTVAGIWLGELLYARNLAMTMRMLQRIRRKEERANE